MPFSVLLYDAQEPRETVQSLPRAGRGKSRGPAGRGLCNLDIVFCIITKRYKFVISLSAIVTAHALISFSRVIMQHDLQVRLN